MSGGWKMWFLWTRKALRARHPERKAKNSIDMDWIPESACCSWFRCKKSVEYLSYLAHMVHMCQCTCSSRKPKSWQQERNEKGPEWIERLDKQRELFLQNDPRKPTSNEWKKFQDRLEPKWSRWEWTKWFFSNQLRSRYRSDSVDSDSNCGVRTMRFRLKSGCSTKPSKNDAESNDVRSPKLHNRKSVSWHTIGTKSGQ